MRLAPVFWILTLMCEVSPGIIKYSRVSTTIGEAEFCGGTYSSKSSIAQPLPVPLVPAAMRKRRRSGLMLKFQMLKGMLDEIHWFPVDPVQPEPFKAVTDGAPYWLPYQFTPTFTELLPRRFQVLLLKYSTHPPSPAPNSKNCLKRSSAPTMVSKLRKVGTRKISLRPGW